MSNANAIATVGSYAVPSTQIGSDSIFDDLAKGSGKYLKGIKLYTKGKAIDMGLIAPGNWGIYESKDNIRFVGPKVDFEIIGRRPAAIDWSVKPAVRVYDEHDPEFIRIRALADDGSKKHECGIELLVYERTTNDLYGWLCTSKSSKKGAKEAMAYMEISEEQAKALQAKGFDVKAGPRRPCTITAKLMDGGDFTYHAPIVTKCSAPIEIKMDEKSWNDMVSKFFNPKKGGGAAVNEEEFDGAR